MIDRRLTGSDLIRSMTGQTDSEEDDNYISLSCPPKPHCSTHHSLSVDLSLKPSFTTEVNMASLQMLQEHCIEDEEDDCSGDNGFRSETACIQDFPMGPPESSWKRQMCNSTATLPLRSNKLNSRTMTTVCSRQPLPLAASTPVFVPSKKREHPQVTSLSRMNANRRSKLGSRISMELFPSNQAS